MAKPQILHIYEKNATAPLGWSFPAILVVMKTLTRLGVAVVQPIDGDGVVIRGPLQMDIKMIEDNYHKMHKRKADKVLTTEGMETMAELHRRGT